jgi:IS4 transposase
MPIELTGRRKLVGQSETGTVYEQTAFMTDPDTGRRRKLRCITVKLNVATRDGEQEIRLLTNLSKTAADAIKVAGLYRKRWSVETLFQEMTENLT